MVSFYDISIPMRQILITGFYFEESIDIQDEIFEDLKPCQFHVVNTFEDFLSRIKEFLFDIIIPNHKLADHDRLSTPKIDSKDGR